MIRTAHGRPLRFFGLVMGGWVLIRLTSLAGESPSPEEGRIARLTQPSPVEKAVVQAVSSAIGLSTTALAQSVPLSLLDHGIRPTKRRSWPIHTVAAARATRPTDSGAPMAEAKATPASTPPPPVLPATPSPAPATPLLPTNAAARPDRWRGSAWLLWRQGSATRADAVTGGRLGGSQAGLRIDYDLTPHASSRTAAYARGSVAMDRPHSPEAAVGLAFQPFRTIPFSLAAERRIALGKGGRDANAVMAVGGFGPTRIAPSLEVEAYAQGGMVGFRSHDPFIDGKISLLTPIARSPFKLGASLSGGAQPDVERLDIGPELQIRLPLKPAAARLSVEWRERIAGQAAPASGLAITLGADF